MLYVILGEGKDSYSQGCGDRVSQLQTEGPLKCPPEKGGWKRTPRKLWAISASFKTGSGSVHKGSLQVAQEAREGS